MGYFSNGTEGDMYEVEYCARCVHGQKQDDTCPVWLAHLMWNYDQFKNEALKDVLETLIPRDKEGFNEQCLMFVEKPE